MLDVIITVSDSTPKQYVNQCRRSIAVAAQLAGYPINIIETPGVPGHIGKAMANGLKLCTSEYVAWVDDDDFVLPNAFSCLHRHFSAAPAAVCAREMQLGANGRFVPQHRRHHLTAFARDVARTLPLDNPIGHMLQCVSHAAACGEVRDEMSWVYVYRIWRSAGLKVRTLYGG